jgi:hypothetical protein
MNDSFLLIKITCPFYQESEVRNQKHRHSARRREAPKSQNPHAAFRLRPAIRFSRRFYKKVSGFAGTFWVTFNRQKVDFYFLPNLPNLPNLQTLM